MSVNLKNAKALKDYIARLVYHGGEPDKLTASELKDVDFIKAEKDKVIRAMTYQWMKSNISEFLAGDENNPCLEKLEAAEEDDPQWLKDDFAEGKSVYLFDETKVPSGFHADLQKITDYLYTVADNYIGKMLTHKNPIITLGALKDRPEHKTFALTLAQANKWHERIAAEAAQRKIAEAEKLALAQGTEFIMNLGDGFSAVKLVTVKALDKESDYMGHCVGEGGYDSGVKNGSIQIYSIRDNNGEPHATFEVRDGKILQCKGKADKPIISKYVPYVLKFVTDYHIEPERDLKSMGLCRDIKGALHNIYDIPAGTEFNDLDLAYMHFYRLPDLRKLKVNGVLYCSGCEYLTSLEGLPEDLKRLDCNGCSSLISLKGLPEGIEVIDCGGCQFLTSLHGLPEGLKVLNCAACRSLTSLEGLPEGLEKLDCGSCGSLETLEGVTKNLKELDCSYCRALGSLKGLSETSIEKLDCSGCQSLTSLEGVSQNLKYLNCGSCDDLISFKGLSEGLKDLNCDNCNSITSLEGLPDGLEKLDCASCTSLNTLKDAPEGLKKLNCRGCISLASLEGLPEGLEKLNCFHCISLISLKGLPEGLKVLDCSDCAALSSFEDLPKGLEVLKCDVCDNVASLNGLPEGLKELYYEFCQCEAALELLPRSLEKFNCNHFSNLVSFKGLPEGIKKIDCNNCYSLTSLEGVPPTIESVDVFLCPKLKYIPENIPNDKIKGLSEEQIVKCKANWRKQQQRKNKKPTSSKIQKALLSKTLIREHR